MVSQCYYLCVVFILKTEFKQARNIPRSGIPLPTLVAVQ